MFEQIEQPGLFAELPAPRPRRPRHPEGELRKANGQFLAIKRAGQLWQENALVALRKFLKTVHGRAITPVFTFEEFRVYCEIEGMTPPASFNAWGALPKVAVKAGLIAWTGGYVKAVRAEAHARPIKLWISIK